MDLNINEKKSNNILHICDDDLTDEQRAIISSNDKNIIVNGVPGSAKTTTLVYRLKEKILKSPNKLNSILLTQVSNVTEEIVKKIQEFLPDIEFDRSTGSRVTAEYNEHSLEFSNYDAFIDSQLRHYESEKGFLEYKKNGILLKKKHKDICKEFKTKKDIYNYLIKNNKLTIKLRNGKRINKIILDEVQDFSQIIAFTCLQYLIKNNEISFEGYGDILQSIWYEPDKNKDLNEISPYAINIFKKIPDIKCYALSLSFRLPWWHGEFLRIINKDANKSYKRNEIITWKEKPTENKDLHKPMYFMHGTMKNNEDAEYTAKQIINIITTAFENDKTLKNGDVTILAPTINDNLIIDKLAYHLKKNNIPYELFKTKSKEGDNTITIDMNKLKEEICSKCEKKYTKKSTSCKKCGTIRKRDKVALISGHAFKGGESKLIIVIGLSEKSLPKENHPKTPSELKDRSLLEVLLSRSQKYLFLGSNYDPTRYITNNMQKLSNVLYLVQDFPQYFNKEINKAKENSQLELSTKIKKLKKFYEKKDVDNIRKLKHLQKDNENNHFNFLKNIAINDIEKPEIYNKISHELRIKNCPKFNNPLNYLLEKKNTTLNTPDRNDLSVTNITEKVNEFNSLNDINDKVLKIETETFGDASSIKYNNVEAAPILGNLPNIMLSKFNDCEFSNFLDRIIKNENIKYIKEEEYTGFFDILKDNLPWYILLEGISKNNISEDISKNNISETNYKKFMKNIKHIYNNENENTKLILIPDYFSELFYNTKLDSNTKIWNLCLLYHYAYSDKYVNLCYKINNDTEYFTGDLKNAKENIDFFIHNERDISDIEICCNEYTHIEDNKDILLKELLLKPVDCKDGYKYKCSINGRIDAYNKKKECLYEFKMSTKDECMKEWKLQILMYGSMGIKEIQNILNFPDNDKEEELATGYSSSNRVEEFKIRYGHDCIYFNDAKIYNFITGKIYNIKIDLELFNKYKEEIYEEILNSYNYPPLLKKNFLNKIITC